MARSPRDSTTNGGTRSDTSRAPLQPWTGKDLPQTGGGCRARWCLAWESNQEAAERGAAPGELFQGQGSRSACAERLQTPTKCTRSAAGQDGGAAHSITHAGFPPAPPRASSWGRSRVHQNPWGHRPKPGRAMEELLAGAAAPRHPAHGGRWRHGAGEPRGALPAGRGAGLDFKRLVCLFVAGQPRGDGKKYQYPIVTYESLLGTGRNALSFPQDAAEALGK